MTKDTQVEHVAGVRKAKLVASTTTGLTRLEIIGLAGLPYMLARYIVWHNVAQAELSPTGQRRSQQLAILDSVVGLGDMQSVI